MAYVVTDVCIKCKYTDCVAVCPVDCFYEGENMLVIHPDECIDCGACEPECPTTAIFAEDEVPNRAFIEVNAFFSGHKPVNEVNFTGWPDDLVKRVKDRYPGGYSDWGPIYRGLWDALPNAEAEAERKDKFSELSVEPGTHSW